MRPQMGQQSADPSHQLFGYFNAFSSPFWQKTRVELVARKVFWLWGTLGHPNLKLTSFSSDSVAPTWVPRDLACCSPASFLSQPFQQEKSAAFRTTPSTTFRILLLFWKVLDLEFDCSLAQVSKRCLEVWKVAGKTLRWNVLFFFDAHAVLFTVRIWGASCYETRRVNGIVLILVHVVFPAFPSFWPSRKMNLTEMSTFNEDEKWKKSKWL